MQGTLQVPQMINKRFEHPSLGVDHPTVGEARIAEFVAASASRSSSRCAIVRGPIADAVTSA